MQIFITLGQPLPEEKYVAEKREEKEYQMYWTLRSAATPKGSARTPLGPIG